ncbi:alcohol dehydrogenase catalytic domain-containing protein [Subtercola vilae]|uniref:Alcohol dehydrogenase n=1 Tax=Subtercola vilae TaxID=2056433 RepID=A0A4T2BZX0_9MICO|nr:alcohol dehydrogenase catalytic domain-containing protein [Subtercola vilae]TIH37415.1 alcohol dehydrogenase [Subtercola vilae]
MTLAITLRPGSGVQTETIALAAPGPGQVEVEIRASGVCHSDLHVVNGDWPAERPLVLGHEAAGIVTAIGAGVLDARLGDHVVLSWFAPCGRCTNCAAGKGWLCTGTTALDNTLPDGTTAYTDARGADVWPYLGLGAFSERVVIPESAVVVVPPELPFEIGALLGCSVTTGIGAVVNTASVPMGASAAVIGCGGVGLSIIMGLKLIGANPIIAIDVSDEKLEAARALGATTLLRGDLVDTTAEIQSSLGGVDFAFEAIGRVATIESLPGLLARGGTAVLVGMTPIGLRASIDPFDLADQGKNILGCNYGSSVARVDIPRLAKLYLAGRLPLDQLIGRIRPLAEASEALTELGQGVGLRTILVPPKRSQR